MDCTWEEAGYKDFDDYIAKTRPEFEKWYEGLSPEEKKRHDGAVDENMRTTMRLVLAASPPALAEWEAVGCPIDPNVYPRQLKENE